MAVRLTTLPQSLHSICTFSPAFRIYSSYTYNYTSERGRPSNIHIKDFDGATGADSPLSMHNISTGGTWVINPTLVNDARASMFRREDEKYAPSAGKNWGATLGIPNLDPALMPAMGTGSQFTPPS